MQPADAVVSPLQDRGPATRPLRARRSRRRTAGLRTSKIVAAPMSAQAAMIARPITSGRPFEDRLGNATVWLDRRVGSASGTAPGERLSAGDPLGAPPPWRGVPADVRSLLPSVFDRGRAATRRSVCVLCSMQRAAGPEGPLTTVYRAHSRLARAGAGLGGPRSASAASGAASASTSTASPSVISVKRSVLTRSSRATDTLTSPQQKLATILPVPWWRGSGA